MTSTVVKLNWFGKNMATLSASRLYEAKHAESMGSGESPCFSTLRRWFRGNRILNYVNDVPGWTRPFKFKGLIPQAESGSRGTRADQGVRPTICAESSLNGKLCGIRLKPAPQVSPRQMYKLQAGSHKAN